VATIKHDHRKELGANNRTGSLGIHKFPAINVTCSPAKPPERLAGNMENQFQLACRSYTRYYICFVGILFPWSLIDNPNRRYAEVVLDRV